MPFHRQHSEVHMTIWSYATLSSTRHSRLALPLTRTHVGWGTFTLTHASSQRVNGQPLTPGVPATSQYFFPAFPNSSHRGDQFPSMWRSFKSRPPTNMAFAQWAHPSILAVLLSIMPGILLPSSIPKCLESMVMASCIYLGWIM